MSASTEKTTKAPLERALVLLRPDLTLQVSTGEQALEIHLDAAQACGLAQALLANIAGVAPWSGREDADVFAGAHDLAFSALRLAALAMVAPPIDQDMRGLLAMSLNGAMAQLELLQSEINAPREAHGKTQAH